jgi:hypothetical protein
MPMVRRIWTPVPMPINSPANMRTGPSKAASGTTCRKRPRRPSPQLSSTFTVFDPCRETRRRSTRFSCARRQPTARCHYRRSPNGPRILLSRCRSAIKGSSRPSRHTKPPSKKPKPALTPNPHHSLIVSRWRESRALATASARVRTSSFLNTDST